MKKMTWEQFNDYLANEHGQEFTEEQLIKFQEEADPEDYDVEIIDNKPNWERGDVIEFKAPTPNQLKAAKLKSRKEVENVN